MPSEFSLYSARSAVNLRIVFPLEEAGANRPLAGTGERHITSRRAITECDSVPEIITIREVYIKRMYLASKTRPLNMLGLAQFELKVAVGDTTDLHSCGVSISA